MRLPSAHFKLKKQNIKHTITQWLQQSMTTRRFRRQTVSAVLSLEQFSGRRLMVRTLSALGVCALHFMFDIPQMVRGAVTQQLAQLPTHCAISK